MGNIIDTIKKDVEELVHPEEEVHEVASQEEDRSAYNCPTCKGEGLKNQSELCPTCKGLGKV